MVHDRIVRPMTVSLFGGSGFIGRYIVRLLASHGHRVIVAARRPKQAIHLKTSGEVGQIAILKYDGLQSVETIISQSDAVISLAGILYESREGDFERTHKELPDAIAQAAAANSLARMVHISAIGADEGSKSLYARSKAHGEKAVLEHYPNATILRPSIVFGAEDNFFNQFASMSRYAPFLPLIGGGKTRFQPVYVNDVATAAVMSVEQSGFEGRIFELGGPAVMTFEDCLRFILKETGRSRPLLTIPMGLARLKATILEKLPQPLLTRDQLLLLETDNVVSADAQGFEAFEIQPMSVETVVPRYLKALSMGVAPLPAA